MAAGFFDKGFASYQVIGEQGLEVAEGAQVKVLRPLYRFRDDAISVASGADPLLALEPWLTPLYERPADGELRQRPGASLFLQAGSRQSGAGQVADSVLDIGRGSLLEVDPGQRIELRSVGQLNVDGRLNAWGGSIELGSVALPDPVRDQVESVGHQRAIRVGEQVCSMSPHALRPRWTSRGGATARWPMVAASSSAARSNMPAARPMPPNCSSTCAREACWMPPAPRRFWTCPESARPGSAAGGSISLASANGLYLDGELRAFAGGEGAAAGSLTLALATPNYLTSLATDQVLRPRELIVGQQREAAGEGRDYAYGHGAWRRARYRMAGSVT